MQVTPLSRYSQLRLIIDRCSGDYCLVSVLFRSVEGSTKRDHRITTVRMECPPGSPQSVEWEAALEAALTAVHEGRSVHGSPATPPPA